MKFHHCSGAANAPYPNPLPASDPLGARVRAPADWRIFDAPGEGPAQREGEGQHGAGRTRS